MPKIECFLCLEIKKEIKFFIKIGSSEWNEQHIENVIEKHLWPMAFLKSKSRWLCSACWQILHDFHDFYKRVKDSNEYYDFMVKSENDMDTEDYEVNDFLLDSNNKSSKEELIQESLDDNTDDDTDTDETKGHIIEEKPPPNVETHETVILKDNLPDNDYNTQAAQGNEDDEETKNPLELASATHEKNLTVQKRNTKHYIAKFYQFTCDICQEPFKSFGMLSHHFRQAHDQEAYMVCCGIKFVSRSVFGEHIQSHLNPESLKCKYCYKMLKNKRNLAYHIARWHEGSIFHCKVCNKRFTDQIKYQEHSEEHQDLFMDSVNNGDNNEDEDDDENSAENDFLDEKLTRPESSCHSEVEEEGSVSNKSRIHCPKVSAKHPPLNNNKNEENVVELCTYGSENSEQEAEETLATNEAVRSQNSSGDALELTIQGYLRKNLKYQCDLCQEPCESFAELRQHFNNDHDGQKAYVVCCDERFRTRQCLSEHVNTHLYPGCFQCQHCRKVLKNKRNFRAHIRRWHKEKTFPCRSCNKRFISQAEYEEHKLLHHLVEKSENRIQSLAEKTESEGVEMDQNEMDNEMDWNSELHENDDEVDTSKEISLEVTVYDDDESLLEAEKKSQCGKSGGSGIKTTPEELMEFDEFLEQNYKFTCHLCDKPEETHENFIKLRQHFATTHEVEGYVMCCGTKFKRRRGLVDHIKGHLDPNYLKCKYCARNLRDRRSLFNHMAFHEGNIRRCQVCDKKFYDPIKYESHRLTHSPKEQVDEIDSYKDSDDDLPLLESIRKQKESKSLCDIETTLEMTLLDDADMYTEETSEVSKPLPDYSKNFQRQLEHDEFLTKHYKLVCPVCEEQHKSVQFQTFALLRDHFALEHKDDAYVICCAYKFKKRDTLVQHIKTHLNPEDFKCEFCSKILKTKRNLQYHIRARHEGKLFRCDICKKKFVEEISLKRHRKNHKPNETTNFPCPECDRSYKIKHKLTHHINTTHRQRYARLCDVCGGYFRDINLFNAHMKTKHAEESEKEKFPCKVCGRILAARASYRLHMKTQHPENDAYTFTCHICSKPVATRGLLNYHIRMCHKTTKQHKCTVCGKAYKELKGLRGHMGIHTGESLFKCNFCPKAFNSTGNRSTHRKKCHPKEWEEFQKKMYIQDISATTAKETENV